MPGNRVAAPLDTCSPNFETQDKDECFDMVHDQNSGKVNLTLNCCIWNELMFKKDSLISANAFRCEILVCEEKMNGPGVEIVSKHPVFTEGKQMTGCCLRDGVMYKPGATFFDGNLEKTLVCCSGDVFALLEEPKAPEPVTEESELLCQTFNCASVNGFQCKVGRRVDKLKLKKTEYALFPSVIHQEGFTMNMYGGRESLQRDCHGHYFFASNVKLLNDKEDLSIPFMGLERKHNLQGFLLKFTPGFRQAWAKMIDVEGGLNPMIKDTALDSRGYIFAMITYEREDGIQVMRVQRYDQCGELDSGSDVKPGTFASREAYLGIDSKDDIVAFHSFSNGGQNDVGSGPNPCHLVKLKGNNMNSVDWQDEITAIEGETSCMPTGVKVDCNDNIYITGFMASKRGFIRKYSKKGEILWTKADFQDQVTEVIYDPRQDVLVITLSTERMMTISADGKELKSLDIK
ncbi:uncharacterized protein LOC111709154 isoform X2 [Eurytemora carolleeae]|uniref:uncharacterized protein LOC111709154 isoform X2 n=1 Tax=Eurytemora carolleeae TaxID=1294199 RepID=UPI000C75E7FD|nr:uncharacterized protein LOC111709154 isoform X2 [Eurytemora carolleeae]|eukprot:XP_023338533.1 uncharacterized protein LOC111709154 isoform X2 [Eurytemora affinis]